MRYAQSVMDIIEQRFSCRTYLDVPIKEGKREKLQAFCSAATVGPFGTPARFELVAATEKDLGALRGLGTYGLIRGATGFFLGAVGAGDQALEDFGYLMEQIVLLATDLDLGTCWLGGTFTRSSFAAQLGLRADESMPAVVSVGYVSDRRSLVDRLIGHEPGERARLPWPRLFFDRQLDSPLAREAAGAYATPLDMVRLGPSASNKQPWRIVRDGPAWHFYLQRTRGYRERNYRFVRVADMQRIDMGIAMSHFQLAAEELGLNGHWMVDEPDITRPDDLTEYIASWVPD
jgi:nitroreductase